MTEIDYEALAKEAYESNRTRGGAVPEVLRLPQWDDAWDAERAFWVYNARAVVAAYRTQQQFHGIIEVRADRLRNMAEQNGRFPMSDAGFAHLIENWRLTEGID